MSHISPILLLKVVLLILIFLCIEESTHFEPFLGRLKPFPNLKGLCAMLVLPRVECLVDCGVFLVQLLVTGHIPHLPRLHSTCHTVHLTQCHPMSLSNCHPTTQNVTQCHHLHPFPGRPCNGRQGHLVAFLTPNNFVWVAPTSTFSLRGAVPMKGGF